MNPGVLLRVCGVFLALALASHPTLAQPGSDAPSTTHETPTKPTTTNELTTSAPTTSALPAAVVALPADAASRLEAQLAEVRGHFQALRCEQVIALAPAVEDHRLAGQVQRQEAAFSRAYCLVVLGNLSDASLVFADIVVDDIDAMPPFEVEPRVMVLLEAARAKEVTKREAARRAERSRLLAQVAMKVTPPGPVVGGNRAFFGVELTDPPGLVRSIRLEFKRPGDADFSALPVSLQKDGSYRGEIPGSFTRSRQGITLEWFIRAVDDAGDVVVAHGSRDEPKALVVAPGSALALDLKANERLPQDARIGLALFGADVAAGALTIVGLVGGLVVGGLFPSASFVQGAALVLFPTLGATVGAWMVGSVILDGPDVAITAGTAGALALATSLISVSVASGAVREAIGGEIDVVAIALPVGLSAVSALTLAAVATTLVVLDEGE